MAMDSTFASHPPCPIRGSFASPGTVAVPEMGLGSSDSKTELAEAREARDEARSRLPPAAFPARISVSSSLLAATMIQKSSLPENLVLTPDTLSSSTCSSCQDASVRAEKLSAFCRLRGGAYTGGESMRYRADIDGLRALAVISVVLFHAGAPWFQGGYVGVDVFFVISGYLITSIIVAELDTKSFSLISFYQRRIRRIFPTLIVVLAFCLVIGFALLTPADYQTLGQSTGAAALFVSNIFFLKQASYFDVAAAEKPLLHTWSLAIEEQYYLFYPPILIALTSVSSRTRGPAVLLGGLVSFAFCAVMIYVKPSATFYLAPTRVWELLFGGLIALNWVPLSNSRTINRSAALFGLACILIPVFLYTPTTRFPGITALPPVIGTILLIWSGFNHQTLVHSWLSTRPMRTVGKASYSLYLWHYPLLAFAGYMTLRGLGPVAAAAVCLLAFAVSILSLRF